MHRVIKKLTDQLAEKPKILFLIDSMGALLSTLLLFVIQQHFISDIGIPKPVLSILWPIAACLFIYSAGCFLLLKGEWTFFIPIIVSANSLYCLLTLILLFLHYKGLTNLGLAYFSAETAVICTLVYIELLVSAKIQKKE